MKILQRKIRLFGVICVYKEMIVKSYGFNHMKPGGKIISCLNNLERWNIDEIVILDISRKNTINKKIVKEVFESGISTPVSYGGGIRNLDDIKYLLDWNIDRFVIETEFNNKILLNKIKNSTGRQSLIRCITTWDKKFGKKVFKPSISQEMLIKELSKEDEFFSEYLIYDTQADGNIMSFNFKALQNMNYNKDLIIMGGLDEENLKNYFKIKNLVGLGFGNKNLEKENFIYDLKKNIDFKFRGKLCRNV